jgi:hypothetical protein
MKPLYGVVYTLLAEIDKLRVAAESDPGNFANWKKARLEQMQERQKVCKLCSQLSKPNLNV